MIVTSDRRAVQLYFGEVQNNPFVTVANAAATATLGGTATLADGARENALSGTTYDFWMPDVSTSEAVFWVDFGAARAVTFAGIAAHTLAALGASAVIERSTDNVTWVDGGAGAIAPTEDRPIGWRMADDLTARYWRLRITGLSAGAALAVGVVHFGDELIMPDRTMSGANPAIRPTEVQLQSNVSAGGHLLGSQIVAQGSTVALSLQRIPADFARGDLVPFIDHFNAGRGFFYGWRPTDYPTDLHYCWRDGAALRPAHTGVLHMMSIDMEARAYDG